MWPKSPSRLLLEQHRAEELRVHLLAYETPEPEATLMKKKKKKKKSKPKAPKFLDPRKVQQQQRQLRWAGQGSDTDDEDDDTALAALQQRIQGRVRPGLFGASDLYGLA